MTLSWLHQQRCISKISSSVQELSFCNGDSSGKCERCGCFPTHGWERVKPQMVVTAQFHARHTITDTDLALMSAQQCTYDNVDMVSLALLYMDLVK